MSNVEWVPANKDGLVWYRRVREGRILGVIVFYRLRGADRAGFWRAGLPRTDGLWKWKSCFTFDEARDAVEVES